MAAAQLGININVTGSDFASGALRSAGKSVGGLQKRTANFGAAAMRIFGGVTAAVTALKGTLSLTDSFASFEQGLGKLGGILDKDIDQLGELRAVALKAGQDTQFSPTEAIEGLQELASKGFDAAESAKLLAPALDFAAGGGISIADASSSAASAVRVFGLNMDEAGGVAGKLLRITSLTSLKAQDMSIALGNVSRGAGLAKQSINEMLPIMGLVKNTGVDASVAATSVSSALQFMAKNSKDIKSKLGVNVADANGQFRAMGDVILDSAKALQKKYPNAVERAAVATKLFGKFGVTAFQAVSAQLKKGVKNANGEILKGAAALQFLRDEMASAGDKAAKFKERMLNTFKGQLTLLKGSAQTFMTSFGEGVAGAIRPAVERAITELNKLTAWFEGLPGVVKDRIGQAVVGFGVFVAVAGIIIAVKAAAALLGGALLTVAAAAAVVGLVLAPFVTFLSRGSEAATSLGTELRGTFNGIGSAAGKMWEKIKAFFSGIGAGFTSIMDQAGPVFKELEIAISPFTSALEGVSDSTGGAASSGASFGKILGKVAIMGVQVLTQLLNVITGIRVGVRAVGGAFAPVSEAFADISTEIGNALTSLGVLSAGGASTATAFERIGSVIGAALGIAAKLVGSVVRFIGGQLAAMAMVVSGVIDIVAGLFTGDWSRVWNGLGKVVVGVVKGIVTTLAFMLSSIASVIDAAGDLAGIKIGAQEKVNATATGIKNKLDSLVLTPQKAEADITTKDNTTAKLDELVANTKRETPPTAQPAGSQAFTRDGALPIDAASIAALAAAAKAGPAPITHATLTVDGSVLGTIVAKHSKDGKNGGTVPVPTAQ